MKRYRFVVDVNLEKFFDTVNHDMLMARVARWVKGERLLKLIRAYLNSGIMHEGILQTHTEGLLPVPATLQYPP